MKVMLKKKQTPVKREFNLPGDKSIAHRALLIGALGRGEYKVTNFPNSLDCLSTVECMRKLGVDIRLEKDHLLVKSPGYEDFNKKPGVLNANNSGTTARLISGLVAGCGIQCTIDGDASLRRRPMDRVIEPLAAMGADIQTESRLLPVIFNKNSGLKGLSHNMKVASAQVKSCILIAGFLAQGYTQVIEGRSTRDHTEKMFDYLGANIEINENKICIVNSPVQSRDLHVPGDISSAAFIIGCALLSDNSEVLIQEILLNEGRRTYLDVLIDMGADIKYEVTHRRNYEECGYIKVRSSNLKGIEITEETVPSIIDEIPMLAVIAAFSEGKTIIRGVGELKHKESNRLKAIGDNLKACGIEVDYTEDIIEIKGKNMYLDKDVYINPHNDHRIALAFTVFGSRNLGRTTIDYWECTNISFPDAVNYFQDFFYIQTQL